jgi:hypothetical protein
VLLAFIGEVIAVRTGGALAFYWLRSGLRCANGFNLVAHGLILCKRKSG